MVAKTFIVSYCFIVLCEKPQALFSICYEQLSVDHRFAREGEYVLYLDVILVYIERLVNLVLKVKALILLKEELHTLSELLVLLMRIRCKAMLL